MQRFLIIFSTIFTSRYLLWQISLILLATSTGTAEAFTIYTEDFNDPIDQGQGAVGVNTSNPPTIDTSGVDWTVNIDDANLTSSDDFFQVANNQFEAQDTDGDSIWTSPIINITGLSDVSFSFDFSELSNLEETGSVNADYVDVTYILDETTTVTIPNQNGVVGEPNVGQHTLLGNFDNQTISQAGLSGSTLQLAVTIRNSAGNELISFDNVLVEAVPWEFRPGFSLLILGMIFSGNCFLRKVKTKFH